MGRASKTHVVIVGAGPYGLSLASHLRAADVPFRIFGRPMQSWATQMPVGMKLKSDGFASNLSSGTIPFTLEDFCHLTGRAYHATQMPVPVEDFVAYGQEFQRRFVPSLEPHNVTHVERSGDKFLVISENGMEVIADHVVIATGVSLFGYVPELLRDLPAGLVTHTADHQTFTEFAGKDVTVIGRGASALNAAALLAEDGAQVKLLTRRQKIHIHVTSSEQRSLWQRMRHPISPLGSGLRSWFSCNFPSVVQLMPTWMRRAMVYKHLGPAGGAALNGRIEGKVETLLGWSIQSAAIAHNSNSNDGRVLLQLVNDEGERREVETAHIIAGTGYRIDMKRLQFLDADMLDKLALQPGGAPRLNGRFQSSVPHLYFIGPSASASFGPLQRFAAGAGFAAERLTQTLQRDFVLRRHRAATHNVVEAANAGQHV